MAMEDTLFIGDFPVETRISSGFSIAAFDSQRVRSEWGQNEVIPQNFRGKAVVETHLVSSHVSRS